MISILPIQPDILQMMAEDTGLTAEGPVWGVEPMPLPMAYTRRGAGSLEALFAGKCPGNTGEI